MATVAPEARLLATLEDLLELAAVGLHDAMAEVSQRLAVTLACDKVDVFLLDAEHQTLRALGTSRTPMGERQRAIGLDTLPLANGGSIANTFTTGVAHLQNHVESDTSELAGIVTGLGARSMMSAPFDVARTRRGVLAAVAGSPDFFSPEDLRFLEAAARWIGIVVHRAELSDEVRASETENARKRAADEIIAVVAHDLRNQLNPVVTRLQLMRLQLERGQSIRPEDVDRAIRSTERLARLANRLLDAKRLDEGIFELDLGRVDLSALAREVAVDLDTPVVRVGSKGAPELVVLGDRERLRQVLENLVSNAVKHSPKDESVEIEVRREGARALVVVTDEGPGIADAVLPVLFERFISGTKSGLGLGLFVAHCIARAHGGDLRAENKPLRGARFTLELPLPPI